MKQYPLMTRKLRAAVGLHDLTQAEFAVAVGVSLASVKDWLRGASEPQGVNRENVAFLFGVDRPDSEGRTVFGRRAEMDMEAAAAALGRAYGHAPARQFAATGQPVIEMTAGAVIGRLAADVGASVTPLHKAGRGKPKVDDE